MLFVLEFGSTYLLSTIKAVSVIKTYRASLDTFLTLYKQINSLLSLDDQRVIPSVLSRSGRVSLFSSILA